MSNSSSVINLFTSVVTSGSSKTYNISSICEQRARQQLTNIPPARFTVISPYPQYTQQQLDMRRKTEILQYKGNSTNKHTKSERYSQLMKQKNQYSVSVLNDISNNIITCTDIKLLPSSSTQSDVPGPAITLQYNPSIPLYNYQNFNIRNYGIIDQQQQQYLVKTSNNISVSDSTGQTTPFIIDWFSLYIKQTFPTVLHNFTVTTPIAFSIQGIDSTIKPQPPPSPIHTQNFVSITSLIIYVDVYYNNTIVATNRPTLLQNNVDLQELIVTHTYNTIVSPTTGRTIITQLNTNYNASKYTINQYNGTITVSNMILNVALGSVYDIKMECIFTSYIDTINTPINPAPTPIVTKNASLIINTTSTGTNSSGCLVNYIPSNLPKNNGFIFSV